MGKTDFSYFLSDSFARKNGVFINCDVGQLYAPLSVGTAKPSLERRSSSHYLFDELIVPGSYTSFDYRARCSKILLSSDLMGKVPLIVGGSLFYSEALFFERKSPVVLDKKDRLMVNGYTWDVLYALDPLRALSIHPHDTYRIERALTLWETTGTLPSDCKATFSPLFKTSTVIFLHREREDLYKRINERTALMLEAGGWIDEVASLPLEWRIFIRKKKIIGYSDIDDYLNGVISYEQLVLSISQKTRNYAKRQCTYWSFLKKKLENRSEISLHEINLSLTSPQSALDFVP